MNSKGSGLYWITLCALMALMAVYAQRRDILGLYETYVHSEEQAQAFDSRLSRLEGEETQLRETVEDLDTDPLEVEAAIRRSKGLVRKGETVYRIEVPNETREYKEVAVP